MPLTSHSSSCQQSATRLSTHPRRFNPHRVWHPYIVHFFYKQNIHALCILSTPVLHTREPARGSFISATPQRKEIHGKSRVDDKLWMWVSLLWCWTVLLVFYFGICLRQDRHLEVRISFSFWYENTLTADMKMMTTLVQVVSWRYV